MAVSNAEFTVRGIESSNDVQAIESELSELEGVMGTEIDEETGEAEIEFDHDIQSEERIEITVEEAGYEVADEE